MPLTGDMLIGGRSVAGRHGRVVGVDAATGVSLEPPFGGAGPEDIEAACTAAHDAALPYRTISLEGRAAFLEAVADKIEALGDALIERAAVETALPRQRLIGERARTTGQLRMFACEVRKGDFLAVRVDPASPERKPVPRPDLRLRKIPVGPVAVFGASNFPLAFSVAGGDTASALAAGCPVVVKAHSAHPGTSRLVGGAVADAVQACGLPPGTFSLLFGESNAVGQALVANPRIKAVGFTGSRAGGLALCARAAARLEPIPVFAAMSSINPVLLFPLALRERAGDIGRAFAASLTTGAGQFCTNPGLVIAIDGPDIDGFVQAAAEAIADSPAQTMLTQGMARAYAEGVRTLSRRESVKTIASGAAREGAAHAVFHEAAAADFLADPILSQEVFGPTSLLVRCRDLDEFVRVVEALEGQLTIALHVGCGDFAAAAELLPLLETKAGRILVNGFGTGVEVAHAMVHGGPFPATSDSRSTSVGSLAMERFLRPVCYQDLPIDLLPIELRDDNALGIWRRVDGRMSRH